MITLKFEDNNFNYNFFKIAHIFYKENNFQHIISDNILELITLDKKTIYKIENKKNILNFLKYNNIDNIQKYNIIEENEYINNDYDYECIIKNTKEIKDEKFKLEKLEDLEDINEYKIKKIYEYKDIKKNINYKSLIININNDKTKLLNSIKNSKYEFEININDKDDIDYYIRQMIFILDNNILPIKKNKQKEILNDYMNFVSVLFNEDVLKIINKNKEIILINPKPTTLEKSNLLESDENNFGIVSILNNYAVTEKADGERFLMYINENSEIYLINNIKQIRGCNIKTECKNCILDGELIVCNKRLNNNEKDLYAIFDIYFYNNKDVTGLPLIHEGKENEDRYTYMHNFINKIKDNTSHDIIVKKQLKSDQNNSIYNRCNQILSETIFDYDIDGLIFTPLYIPVYSNYANKPVKIGKFPRWEKVFKWKPPEQNSIDFLVKEVKNKKILYDGKEYKEFILQVSYGINDISVFEGIKNITSKTNDDKNYYQIKDFIIDNKIQKSHILIKKDGKCYTDEEDVIEDNSIIEFYFDNKTPTLSLEKKWKPLRVRYDKNKKFNNKDIDNQQTINHYDVAMNVWRSIDDPITTELISGLLKEKDMSKTNNLSTSSDKYYNRFTEKHSNIQLSKYLNYYHNHIIKFNLYNNRLKKDNLLELGCGQGSDMTRWVRSGYKNILGIDKSLDNIKNPNHGIYNRYIKYIKNIKPYYNKQKINAIFVAGDCGKNIITGECSDGIDIESKRILKFLFGKKDDNEIINLFNNNNYFKYFKNEFNVVSCMFSIHYFFENEEILDMFIKNVSNLLSNGGEFICTFMDSKLVEKKLKENNGKLIGKEKISNSIVWAIIQKYNDNTKQIYNKNIEVYLENTGRLIEEYLVNTDILITKFEKHNIYKKEEKLFETIFKDKFNDLESLNEFDKDIITSLNEDEILKEFSFLNKYLVFYKDIYKNN